MTDEQILTSDYATKQRQTPLYKLLQRVDQFLHDIEGPEADTLHADVHDACFEMMRPPPVEEVERAIGLLLVKEHKGRYEMGGGNITSDGKPTFWGGEKIMEYRNPDGPAIAAMLRKALATPPVAEHLPSIDEPGFKPAPPTADLRRVVRMALEHDAPPVANTLTEGQLLSDKGEVERLRRALKDIDAAVCIGSTSDVNNLVSLINAMKSVALTALRPHDEAVVEGEK